MNMNKEDRDELKKRKNNSHSRSPDLRNNNSPDQYILTTELQQEHDEEDDDLKLALTLFYRPPKRSVPVDQPLPPPPTSPPPPLTQSISLQVPHHLYAVPIVPFVPESSSSSTPLIMCGPEGGPSRPIRARRNQSRVLREGKSDTVIAPFPWATTRRATVYSLECLLSKQIDTITGFVQCKRCERQYEMGYNLEKTFNEVGHYIAENKNSMHDRAPSKWMNPVLPKCEFCGQENSAKPIISQKKKAINWLFLLLGQMLGCCTLEQLKYFCKHTKNHRTGAKDRVLYLTYLGLCKQLDLSGPFDR
ncbi:hypothetical protein F2P56_029289 [Juglans regia]|uniref:DUF7086 domain-containing protein n=2 Tax=Juglans regia TaxID=51240 RepID=A0A833UD38_JUGRE|nr:uncharacterized protein LOC109012065 [Juglans regia]KAF5448785.1 hypothetical protein F2P56_029289 [Juglans regia]